MHEPPGDFQHRRRLWIRSSSLVLSSHPRQYLCSLPASCILCQINRAGYESLACVCRHETQHCILVLALFGTFVQYARNILGLLGMSVETVSFQFFSKQHGSLCMCAQINPFMHCARTKQTTV